jgi:16S rRNA (adenine1518-N6/adenine1519-N6)-dimethyltransferase
MENLTSPRKVKEIIERHAFRFSKSLGQNFLIDENILKKIVNGADIQEEDGVLEVGPGIGTLTRELARRSGQVVAVEIDKALLPILEETLAGYNNIQLIHGDILKLDLSEILHRYFAGRNLKIVANLPYYITTPIISRFLEEGIPFDIMVVMIQKEVADRIAASPGSKDYSALSVGVQYFTQPRIIGKVPAGVFYPPPKVDSTIIALKRREEAPVWVKDRKLFFRLVKAAFAQRRKTLLNTLSSGALEIQDKEFWKGTLEKSGIDPNRRGETLSLEEFGHLANVVADAEEVSRN